MGKKIVSSINGVGKADNTCKTNETRPLSYTIPTSRNLYSYFKIKIEGHISPSVPNMQDYKIKPRVLLMPG